MPAEALAPTIWLGAKLSGLAAVLAVLLSLVGDVSQWSLVAAVAVTAFAASWVQAGRLQRGEGPVHLLAPASSPTAD